MLFLSASMPTLPWHLVLLLIHFFTASHGSPIETNHVHLKRDDASSTATASSRFHFYNISTPAAGPCDLCTGPDGAEWFQYLFAEKIARIDPDTNEIEEFQIPFKDPLLGPMNPPVFKDRALAACVIRPGRDGNIYAANGLRNQIVKVDLKTKRVSVFDALGPFSELGNLQPFNDMWGAPEGMYYSQSSANLISLFDYNTHAIKSWKIPTPASFPLGMRTSYDGALWFTELAAQKIGRLNHTTGDIKEYPLPVPALIGPAVLRVQTEGKYIWFTGIFSNSLGRLNIYTGEVETFTNDAPNSALSFPSEDTLDTKTGKIWFSTWNQNFLNNLDPKTGAQQHIEIPENVVLTPVSLPYGLNVGIDYFPPKNRIYFSQATLNRIGYYQL